MFNQKILNKYLGLITTISILILSFLREPLFFTRPRIWAEEGAVHIQSVLNNGLLESLFQPHIAYYSFFNNYVAGFGVSWLGVDNIAYVTTLSSFLIIILTLITPLLLTSDLWDASWKKLSIIFFSLFIGASEIWVNTINSQFYLGLFSCFLLLSDTENLKSWRTCYVLFMVFNAALTGITSVILLPFYFIQYLRKIKTSSLDKIILIILTLGLTIQILALLHLSSNSSISRFNLNNMINFPNGVYQNLTSIIPVSGNLLRIGFLSIFISALMVRKNDFKIILPAIIAIYVSMTFAFLALSMSGGGRYGYMPAVLCFIFLLNLYPTQNRSLRTFYIIIISALLCVSFLKFFKTRDVYDQSWIPYSLKNGYLNTEGSIEVKIFPQWNNTNWSIKIPNDKYKSN